MFSNLQTHCQKNKKIKRADQILPEVYGTTFNSLIAGCSTPDEQYISYILDENNI
jgi:hypothetical protein